MEFYDEFQGDCVMPRNPSVAGAFYPSEPELLKKEVSSFLGKAGSVASDFTRFNAISKSSFKTLIDSFGMTKYLKLKRSKAFRSLTWLGLSPAMLPVIFEIRPPVQ